MKSRSTFSLWLVFALGLTVFALGLTMGALAAMMLSFSRYSSPVDAQSGGATKQTMPLSSPTATSTIVYPTATVSWRLYATLQETPQTTRVPPAAAMLPIPDGEIVFLLLGSDQRPGQIDFNTDVIMLAFLHPSGGGSLFSFPRNLLVYMPGFKMGHIHDAYPVGGFELIASTMEYNFGVRPQYFAMIDFGSFIELIDDLNGLDVAVQDEMHDARTGYPDGYTVSPGEVHMDGEMALWYARARQTSSDLDRNRRQQEIIVALIQRHARLKITEFPEIFSTYQEMITTNLTLADLLHWNGYVPDLSRVETFSFTSDYITAWVDPGTDLYYLIPDIAAIQTLLAEAIGEQP